jgi:hypothetical protein
MTEQQEAIKSEDYEVEELTAEEELNTLLEEINNSYPS